MTGQKPQTWLRRVISRSLAVRVIAFSSFWAVIALVVIATIISTLFRQVSERGFDSVLSAYLNNVIGSVGVAADGGLRGSPNLDDMRFLQPHSGWYWSVEPVTGDLGTPLRSPSMVTPIPAVDIDEVPFNTTFQRTYNTTGPIGETVEVFEAELVVGDEGQIARFRVMGNRSELEEEISRFVRRLYGYLAVFGLGMIAINVFAILYGLRPLNRVQQALSDIRAGTAQRLAGPFPTEIESLAEETNALIDNNRRIVERSRKQVGNLAHSLKTPLAVVMNEARAVGGARGQLISAQAQALQQQLDHYLQRARIVAQRDSLVFRTPVQASLERMARVMGKLNPSIELEVELAKQPMIFAGEQEDLDDICGNLMENAMKWASKRVSLTAKEGAVNDAGKLQIVIEDDGPGIPEEKARDVLKRGRRLDETKPGTGLGLAIVADLVDEYGGSLSLERSEFGGLKATVALPRAEA
ncbi:sensor histidine kinase [Nitratireductor sp. GISD-1A_MAKvit]|uniref:sensor histidine kinase n=1 Tax=Nitratireductor sp. GISD-1A_MAKvit TaxID=3234198 RepID=UPI003465D595